MSESKVFLFDSDDPAMQRAYEEARSTFKYFWREIAWERRRIIPGLDLACVKAPFSDSKRTASSKDNLEVEQMWLGEIDFDGQFVSGELLNAPNWLKSVKAGDSVRLTLNEITDWMYAIDAKVFGGYTVNLMRSRMSRGERNEHDSAWGLNFGDPNSIRIMPVTNTWGGMIKGWFGGKSDPHIEEHPMSEAMAPSLKEQLTDAPAMLNEKDDRGWTFLHHQALAGSTASVKILLELGADTKALTDNGMTPLQLAKSLGWDKVIALLKGR